LDDKIHFVFNMYDVSHDSTVSKQELSTLLNHIPKEAFPETRNVHSYSNAMTSPSNITRNTSNGSIANLNSASLLKDTTHLAPAGDTSDSEKGSVNGDQVHDDYEEIDHYTNHDMVEKAFAECDLNHEGRLTYEEFKMWVQRNPSIMDYIESILPYNGPKDMNPHHDKKETLPHLRRIASRAYIRSNSVSGHDSTQDLLLHSTGSKRYSASRLAAGNYHDSGQASPLLSRTSSFQAPPPPAAGKPDGIAFTPCPSMADSALDVEEQARQLMTQAMEATANPELKGALAQLLDLFSPECNERPLSVSEVYRAAVSREGYLWKKGKSLFHMLGKRWYLLAGNCMYYYSRPNDIRPKGVIFLTGSIIERVKDEDMALKGLFGLEITHQDLCTGEHHRHDKRVLYTRSEHERDEWVSVLQHAAHVVPIEDDYVICKELGRGRFSVVCECVHKVSGIHCAVKIIDKATIEPEEKSLLRTEIAVLKLVNHPNIIKMLGLYESKHHIYIVMEMLKGGELFERIVGRPRFTELEAAKLLRPLLESVAYLHDLGIVHRDLKPENILCGDELDDLKIADFGLSKMVLPKEKMDAACGTLSYVAPEVLTMQGYGKETDLWSVGVILFLLLCGKLPFDGEDHNEIIRSTIQADLKVNPTVWTKLSEDAKNLITSLLNKNAKERITAREALRHPFIVSNLGHYRRVSPAVPYAVPYAAC
jgi:Ca2+-binding EF-hand superfamily protein